MLRFVLYGFALFVERALSHVMVCFALFAGEGSCHTLRFALVCFGLFRFAATRGKLSNGTICIASIRFASFCTALFTCVMTKTNCYKR